MRHGPPVVVVQPGVVCGPGDRGPMADTFAAFLRRRLPLVPAKNAYCWGHVTGTALAHLLAMEKGRSGDSYIIGGLCAELSEVLAILERLSGVPRPQPHNSPGLLRTASRVVALVDRLHPLKGTLSPETLRVGAGASYLGNNAKAVRELEIFMRSIEEGLRESLGGITGWRGENRRLR
jgi:nucleoside-diphosphate-sugar epimerase